MHIVWVFGKTYFCLLLKENCHPNLEAEGKTFSAKNVGVVFRMVFLPPLTVAFRLPTFDSE